MSNTHTMRGHTTEISIIVIDNLYTHIKKMFVK